MMCTRCEFTPRHWNRLTSLMLGAAAAILMLRAPAAAQEPPSDEVRVVKRPVVVVGDSSDPVVAWSLRGSRAFLGVQSMKLTPELLRHFSVPAEAGVMIASITPDSPAARSGVQVGDVLTAVDGEVVTSPRELAMVIGRREFGSTVDLEIWRDGERSILDATLVEREGPWVDIRQFHLGDHHIGIHQLAEGDLEGAIELETETLNLAIERLNEAMSSPEWRQRVERFQEHQGHLMERLETLEHRLRELEQELEALPED